jgi:hypothetical protein
MYAKIFILKLSLFVESDFLAAAQTETEWDEQTDAFITAIDNANKTEKSYDISLRDLLTNPNKYMTMVDLEAKISSAKKAVDKYFATTASNFEEESKELNALLIQCDDSYSKINETISSKSSTARVPYVSPYFVYSDPESREEILIEKHTEEIDFLIGKLVNVSHYVADLSGSFRKHKLGSWLFSGEKNYVLSIRAPESILMDMERSNNLINNILDSISEGYNMVRKNAQKT